MVRHLGCALVAQACLPLVPKTRSRGALPGAPKEQCSVHPTLATRWPMRCVVNGLRKQALMCYKSLGSRTVKAPSVHSPEGIATAWRYQTGPQLYPRAPPDQRIIGPQLKIVVLLSRISPQRDFIRGLAFQCAVTVRGPAAAVAVVSGRSPPGCRTAVGARTPAGRTGSNLGHNSPQASYGRPAIGIA
jgi:hypothetical protein